MSDGFEIWRDKERAKPENQPCEHAAIALRANPRGGWDCGICGKFFTVAPELSKVQRDSLGAAS